MQKEGLFVRALIGAVFVVAGVGKLMDVQGTATYIAALGVPMASLVVWAVIFVELVVGLWFVLGINNNILTTRRAAWILMAFTVLATLLAHRDWSNQMNMIMALKNLAIIGALMGFTGCMCACTNCEKGEHCAMCPTGKKK